MLFLTLYASAPQARSYLMHIASDTLSSSGLTSSILDLYKTAETDRSANFVLHLGTHSLQVLQDTLVYEIQIVFSIILYTPHEMQLDETVIFFTEHSMKLYAVVDGAS